VTSAEPGSDKPWSANKGAAPPPQKQKKKQTQMVGKTGKKDEAHAKARRKKNWGRFPGVVGSEYQTLAGETLGKGGLGHNSGTKGMGNPPGQGGKPKKKKNTK